MTRPLTLVPSTTRTRTRIYIQTDDGPLVIDEKGEQVSSLQKREEEGKRPRQEAPDASPPRRKRHGSPGDASPPRRRRHDSDNDASPPRRKRHDSPGDASPPRRKRHDSPDASPPRRKRHDSPDASPPRRRRHDSDDDASPPRRRKRHDSPEPAPEPKKEVGLKTGAEFKRELEAKKAEEARRWAEAQRAQGAAELTGQNAETVIRDRRGRKLEALSEFMNQVRCVLGWGAGFGLGVLWGSGFGGWGMGVLVG